MYDLDVDGEYSGQRKYLTVEVVNSSQVADELATLARIANALNRSLVLPPLRCINSTRRYCNLCSFDFSECFSERIALFNHSVKESVFFTNQNVPQRIVQENAKNPIHSFERGCIDHAVYSNVFPPYKGHYQTTLCHSCEGEKESCIIEEGLKDRSMVLKLYSICSCFLESRCC